MNTLKVGTRASLLARTQCGHVADMIRERLGVEVELVEITTEGDISRAPLATLGGTGVFVSALRDALLDGRVDIAVHSLKDIPTAAADGIELAAVPVREDPRDVLVARDGRIAAIIDFDDMLIGWRVAEPAIAAAYLARHTASPESAVAAVAAGWEAELPFTAAERRVFPALVLARLALNITIWHVRISDSRAEYAQMRATGSEHTFHALHTAWAQAREHAR